MKPEMKFDGCNSYTLTTTAGETVTLDDADLQEIGKFLRHREWEVGILEQLSEEGVIMLGNDLAEFITECLEEAESRFETYGGEPVSIEDVFCYTAENWGLL